MRRECRGPFSPPPRASDPNIHRGTCVTHVPWCMPGSLTSCFLRSGFPGIPSACATRNFAHLVRGPWRQHMNHITDDVTVCQIYIFLSFCDIRSIHNDEEKYFGFGICMNFWIESWRHEWRYWTSMNLSITGFEYIQEYIRNLVVTVPADVPASRAISNRNDHCKVFDFISKWPTGSGEIWQHIVASSLVALPCNPCGIYKFRLKQEYFFLKMKTSKRLFNNVNSHGLYNTWSSKLTFDTWTKNNENIRAY